MRTTTAAVLGLVLLAGCGGPEQPAFPELHPVKGVIRQNGKPVAGGTVKFAPDPEKPEFIVNSQVGPDGTFNLTTVRTTDKAGERKPGAPAGTYRVTYYPPAGDQTAGPQVTEVVLAKPVIVDPHENDLNLDATRP